MLVVFRNSVLVELADDLLIINFLDKGRLFEIRWCSIEFKILPVKELVALSVQRVRFAFDQIKV